MSGPVQREVADALRGVRLDRALVELGIVPTRGAAEALVEGGGVRVDGRPRAKSFRVLPGMLIEADATVVAPVTAAAPAPATSTSGSATAAAATAATTPRIVYEDAQLLVVDKPADLVTHPAPGARGATVVELLAGHGLAGGDDAERPGVVHRLDRDTSGLLLLAREPAAHAALQAALRARTVRREYRALVHGRPPARAGRIEAPIGRDPSDRTRMAIDGLEARPALTHFTIAEAVGDFTLLDLRLETGRTHQIRVHLEAIGHPVVGDPVYTPPTAERLGLTRQFLHAFRLAFAHPATGEPLAFESPLPDDLGGALARARALQRNSP